MNFQEMIEDDLDIFINPDEFGEEITLDDVTYTAVVISGTKDISGAYGEEVKEGILKRTKTLHIKTSDISGSFEQGKAVILDDFPYLVSSSTEISGITTIELEENSVW